MNEQRRSNRITVEGIRCGIISATEVEIMNMSVGGVALIANGRLNIGSDYVLKIERGGSIWSLKGTIVWSVLSGSKKNNQGEVVPIYKAGLKFKDTQSATMTEILDFIEHYKKSPEQRVIVRFDISSSERATLNLPVDFKVKKLSLGGLLIETDQAFAIGDSLSMELSIDKEDNIRFVGRVASCLGTAGSGSSQYNVGIEFLQITDRSLATLKKFIDSH